MKTLAAVLLATFCCASALACDKVDAAKVQIMLSEMGAEWSDKDGSVAFHWGWEWDGATRSQRLQLLRAFAEGDACLTGRPRPVSFYRKGELVGRSWPGSGVQLTVETPAARAQERSGLSVRDFTACSN